jgi:copper chaperone CopZ
MTCDNCVHHVTKAVGQVDGVSGVSVSLVANTAEVVGDFEPVKVVEAIEEEGYEAAVRG